MSFVKNLPNEDGKVTLEKFDENLFNFSNQESLDIEVKNLCFLDLVLTYFIWVALSGPGILL